MKNGNWENTYANGKQINSWPFSDLVSTFMRFKGKLISERKTTGQIRVLELGFGTGNNIEFFLSQGIDYFGIEFSPTAFEIAGSKFPQLSDRLKLGTFLTLEEFSGNFDAVIDRGSVTCCNSEDVKKAIASAHSSLGANGLYFGFDWFSKSHSDFSNEGVFIDSCTKTNFVDGQFKDTGVTHFVNLKELSQTFSAFEVLEMSEKKVFFQGTGHQFASWNIVARKAQ